MRDQQSARPELAEIGALASDHLRAAALVFDQVAAEPSGTIVAMAAALTSCLRAGGKVLLCGNGGSAAMAQHLAGELVGRYLRERQAIPALALTTDTSILTAVGNDYRFDDVFLRQIEAIADPGDVLIALSTSGSSPNVVLAAQAARCKKVTVLALTGQSGGELAYHADVILRVPSSDTPIVQEAHLAIGHVLCDVVERALIAAPETFGMRRGP
jgi:D-sedoheptulose 7-phosphate isomerase